MLVAPAAAAAAPQIPVRPVSPDADFLIAAHQANLAQIKIGKIAARKATTTEVRDLGRRFRSYHRELDAEVRTAARKLNVRLPSAPNSEQLDLIEQYRAASATEFDALFVTSQLLAHQRAVKLTKIVLATGSDLGVRRIVVAATPVVQKHYAALVSAQQQIGGAPAR